MNSGAGKPRGVRRLSYGKAIYSLSRAISSRNTRATACGSPDFPAGEETFHLQGGSKDQRRPQRSQRPQAQGLRFGHAEHLRSALGGYPRALSSSPGWLNRRRRPDRFAGVLKKASLYMLLAALLLGTLWRGGYFPEQKWPFALALLALKRRRDRRYRRGWRRQGASLPGLLVPGGVHSVCGDHPRLSVAPRGHRPGVNADARLPGYLFCGAQPNCPPWRGWRSAQSPPGSSIRRPLPRPGAGHFSLAMGALRRPALDNVFRAGSTLSIPMRSAVFP